MTRESILAILKHGGEIGCGKKPRKESEAMMALITPQVCKNMFPTLNGLWGTINLEEIARDLSALLGLTADSPNPFLNPHYCEAWKVFLLKLKEVDYAYGGYMEDRAVVWRDHYHEPGHTNHVGVDFYVPEGTPLYMPTDAKLIHSTMDQDQSGGWGGKLTFHWAGGYFILAHLNDIVYEVGKVYTTKDKVAVIGGPDINGGWSPHLHLQCMREPWTEVDGYLKLYDGIEKDYPDPMKMPWGMSYEAGGVV
jgi:hypothetical protein